MKRFLIFGIITAAMAFSTVSVEARDISFTNTIGQDAFNSLSKEAGSALGYRNLAPAEPLGISGFDIGVEVSGMNINRNSEYWDAAFGGAASDAPPYLLIPKLRVRKGLPLGIDVGASYTNIPSSNIRLYGFEVSKAILDGTVATPAVGVRATYTKLTGVEDLSLQTFGFDASVSKGFLFLTPYAGAGMMWIKSDAKGNLKSLSIDAENPLSVERISIPRIFAGLKISPFPLIAITAEAEYSERPIYSLKAAVCF